MAGRALDHVTLVGQTLGHYRIVDKIGAGGMGEVYRAHDEHLDRDVAIKLLPPGTLTDEAARKRFRKEARSLSKLNHPNIATVHDFDSQGDVDYLVMEYVPGKRLRDRISEGPLPHAEIIRISVQLANGLTAAHERGLVHRDLKPENVRLTLEGRPKILDFGLAKLIRPLSDSRTTESNISVLAGTLPYMSPEQVLGSVVDQRSDVFSFGVVLYEMATGALPFHGETPGAISDAILHGAPIPPVKLNPTVSTNLETIIIKALEKDRNLRYQSASEMRTDLKRLTRDMESGLSAEVSAASQALAERSRKARVRWKMMVPVGVLVAVLALAAAFWLGRGGRGSAGGTASIAVLPFVDMSPEKNQEYFSDGLAEELLNDLAKIQGLRVAARTSSFQFKGKTEDLRTVGEKLNVGTILEGSVRKQGSRVRVTAQLIKVEDGFHLWSETYDRQLNDIFAVQEEIARSVAGSLKVALLGGRTATPARGTNAEGYNAYLQGRYFLERPGKENVEKAIGYFEQAIKLDPSNALAWVGLAEAGSFQADAGYLPVEGGYQKAREAAERALALDANLAEAHAAIGWIKMSYDWDWAGADASYQRALALEPGNATVVRRAAVLAFTLGRLEEAMALDRRAVELDPLSVPTHSNLGLHAYYAGRPEEAVAAYKKALELNPESPGSHTGLGQVYLAQAHPQEALAEMEREPEPVYRLYGLALAYHALGRKKESDAALAELIGKYHADWAFQIAEVYAFRGEADRAFEWLERAYAQRDGGFTQMKGDPLLKSLERDPRYAAFLKKMRLPA